MMKQLILLHRWLGVLACIAVLMFAGSGVLHPVMSRFLPQPAQFLAPAVDAGVAPLSLRAVLDKNRIDEFSAATLIQLAGGAAYRVEGANGVFYLRTDNGEPIADGERTHAEFLARHFLGDQHSGIAAVTRIDSFDDDYVFINRLLPAWRIDFDRDDGMRVYVDTAGNRLATLSDRPKRIFQTYFRTLHDFEFLDGHNTLRVTVMLVLLGAAFSTAVAGVIMYVRLRRAAQRLQRLSVRRWHRRLSLAVAVVMFSFTLSGTWHLLQSQVESAESAAAATLFRREEIGDATIAQGFVLLRSVQPCYRVNAAPAHGGDAHEHHHPTPTGKSEKPTLPECLDTQTAQPIAAAETAQAEKLARFYSGSEAPLTTLELVTRFEGEYGFVNKRLPVWKVQFAGDPTRWYVETSSGALALRADVAAAREGWFFSMFHKARFIGDAWKNLRDGVLMAAALACITVALLGLTLFVQQLRRDRMRGDSLFTLRAN